MAAAAFLVAVLGSAGAQERVVPQSPAQVQLSFAPVVSKVAPAVVNVYARRVIRQPVDPIFQQFFGASPMRSRVEQSLGSGVIVRADGIIVTNNHVIEGGQDIRVSLTDRREFDAKVIIADARTDLAVLRIDTKGEKLPALPFGDSDKLEVGDLVLAIGDPFGVGQTVTMGIVSALARTQIGASDYQFFIQTDAAINPGNSGGALVTADGKLAGINTAIYSRTGEYAGIGFATPANLARRVVEGALGGGVKLPWFGADGQPVTAQIAQAMNLPRPGGVLVKSVYAGSPAAGAGLKQGDVVLSIDGVDVDDMQALNYRVATHRPGEVVHVRVAGGGGKTREISFALTLPPENPPRQLTAIAGRNPLTGAHVENLSPAVASYLQLDFSARGVVVVSTSENTPSGSYGFQAGDIIRSINGQEIHSVGELQRALESAEGRWDMVIQRGDQRMSLSVSG